VAVADEVPTREGEGSMKTGRQKQPRIDNIDNYPKRWVHLVVAAEYLEIDVRTLGEWIDDGRIVATPYGKFRRIHIDQLRKFHAA
jgi:excisionase family DNA binding protein